jgi:DNA-binding transcriptional regulator YdaS (Cro superfamily)
MNSPIERAIDVAGGVSALATAIGVRPNVVGNWKLRGNVPAAHCLQIEQATAGAVTRYDLRPDVFGSAPELAA